MTERGVSLLQSLLAKLKLNTSLDRLYRTFSIGSKRKVSLILALLNEPDIILLDEPVAGLDDVS